MKTLQNKDSLLLQIGKTIGLSLMLALIIGGVVFQSNFCMAALPNIMPVLGKVKNDLRPSLTFEQKYNWAVYIQFTSTHPVEGEWWSCIANKLGSRLRVWMTNGVEVFSKDPDVESAMHQPNQVIMSDLYFQVTRLNHPPITLFHLDISPDAVTGAYMFQLGKVFPLESNHEYVVELTPMLYGAKLNSSKLKSFGEILTNRITTDLIKFSPIMVRLETNGAVTSLDTLPWTTRP
jgi:hypothetical protein